MPTETLPPARAARQIGVPPNTLRSWCRTYAEFLTPGANPAQGEERKLTPADVETLKAVAQLRANDIPPEDIITRLRENPDAATIAFPQKPLESPVSRPLVQNDLEPAHDAIQRFLAASDLRDKLTDIDRRLEHVESQRNLVLVAVVAFAGGAVVVAVVAWLLSIMR